MLQVYLDDDTTELTDLPIEGLEAGEDSDVLSIHIWNDKGNDAGQELPNVLTVLRTLHPTLPGVWVADGLPPQDQLWCRFKVTGYTNAGDPTWSIPLTDYMPLGAWSGELFGTIPPNCAVHADVLMHPPRDAKELSWTWKLDFIHSEYSVAIPPALSMVDRGVLTGVGDGSHSGILYASLNAEDTPGDTFIAWPAAWVEKGQLYGDITRHPALDQHDANGDALAVGEYYIVVVTTGAGTRILTKGVKGTAPIEPAAPGRRIGVVRVHYRAGGTSVLNPIDVENLSSPGASAPGPSLDRFQTLRPWQLPFDDLHLPLSGGWAVGGGTLRFARSGFRLLLVDDSILYIWQLASGLPTFTDSAQRPEATALPLYIVTTAGGQITAIFDLRTYAGFSRLIDLAGDCPGSPGEVASYMVAEDHLVLERPMFRLSDNGGGSAGETKLDILVNGSSIYVDHATDDLRPHVPFDSTGGGLIVDEFPNEWGTPQNIDLYRGYIVSLVAVEYPTGGVPAKAWAHLLCRRP